MGLMRRRGEGARWSVGRGCRADVLHCSRWIVDVRFVTSGVTLRYEVRPRTSSDCVLGIIIAYAAPRPGVRVSKSLADRRP